MIETTIQDERARIRTEINTMKEPLRKLFEEFKYLSNALDAEAKKYRESGCSISSYTFRVRDKLARLMCIDRELKAYKAKVDALQNEGVDLSLFIHCRKYEHN